MQIWDVNQKKIVRVMKVHEHRVGACAWNNSLIASGSKDKRILVRDLRAADNCRQEFIGHK